jgi:hypothetical protein
MKTERDAKNDSTMIGTLLLLGWLLFLVCFNTGCASGGRVYAGYETVDRIEKAEHTDKAKTLACWGWGDCGGPTDGK